MSSWSKYRDMATGAVKDIAYLPYTATRMAMGEGLHLPEAIQEYYDDKYDPTRGPGDYNPPWLMEAAGRLTPTAENPLLKARGERLERGLISSGLSAGAGRLGRTKFQNRALMDLAAKGDDFWRNVTSLKNLYEQQKQGVDSTVTSGTRAMLGGLTGGGGMSGMLNLVGGGGGVDVDDWGTGGGALG